MRKRQMLNNQLDCNGRQSLICMKLLIRTGFSKKKLYDNFNFKLVKEI